MAFDNSDQPREADGRFGEKVGANAEIALAAQPETARDRLSKKSNEAWERYRAEQSALRQELPAAVAETVQERFPGATGIIFETEKSEDGWGIAGYGIISVEGVEPIDPDSEEVEELAEELKMLNETCIEYTDDFHEVADSQPTDYALYPRWKMTF